MKKLIFLLAGTVFSLTTRAHNPQLSTLTIVQQEGKKMGMMVTVPLITCELALRSRYPGLATDSIDINRFSDLLIDLIKKRSLFIANGSDTLTLTDAKINAGHDTELYFQFQEMVENLDSLRVVFDPFASLTDHNTILRIQRFGQSVGHFILNRDNQYRLSLKKEADRYSVVENQITPRSRWRFPLVLLSLLMASVVFISYSTRSKKH